MNSLTDTAMTEESITDYLQENPDFFERHAEMLTGVRLISGHGPRAVSLQERQAEMLREKIKGLEHRIMDMVRRQRERLHRQQDSPVDPCPGQGAGPARAAPCAHRQPAAHV
jgi:uncharacterized protein YigA (DUF484 family)